jgi:hypothetical protein
VRPTQLHQRAERNARRLHEESGVRDISIDVEDLPAVESRARVVTLVEGLGHLGALRSGMCWFLDQGGGLWSLSITGTAAVPRSAILAELDAASRSWRTIARPRAATRPWWRVW